MAGQFIIRALPAVYGVHVEIMAVILIIDTICSTMCLARCLNLITNICSSTSNHLASRHTTLTCMKILQFSYFQQKKCYPHTEGHSLIWSGTKKAGTQPGYDPRKLEVRTINIAKRGTCPKTMPACCQCHVHSD